MSYQKMTLHREITVLLEEGKELPHDLWEQFDNYIQDIERTSPEGHQHITVLNASEVCSEKVAAAPEEELIAAYKRVITF